MGYVAADIQITGIDAVKDYIKLYRENNFIRNMVHGYAARFPSKVIMLEKEPVPEVF